MIRRPALALAVLAVLLVASSPAARDTASLGALQPAPLRETVEILAAADHAGRRAGTPEGDRAARLIARWLADAGLHPGGDAGGYLQTFVLERARQPGPRAVLAVTDGTIALAAGADWLPHGGSQTGAVVAPLAFVGHGVVAPGWDDYAGVDVRGAVALALEGGPPPRPGLRASRLQKLIAARRRGAAALLLVDDTLPSPRATGAPVALLSGAVTPAAADALLAASGRRLDELADRIAARGTPAPFVSSVPVRLHVDLIDADVTADNVIGILPGADPARAHEAIVIGAHHDHVGVIDGTVHPGADDNASGTAVALGLARAFAQAGGAGRTLVFAFFGAEEAGLVGSAHYVRRPAWPLERTVAMLNFDMVGRMREDRLLVGGVDSGAGLREVVERAARAAGVRLELRPSPFAPSDHSRFYASGTPVLFFFTGLHEDYHRPGDTPDRINAVGMARVADVAARVVVDLAGASPPAYVTLDPPRGRAGPALAGAAAPVVLGVGVDTRRGGDGVPLAYVMEGGAAARAGLREGDVLVSVDDQPVDGVGDLRAVLARARPGQAVRIVYLRDGVDHTATATLEASR